MTKKTKPQYYAEPFRPQFHFSPSTMWMNDPNGMVYHAGTYHLFYQYHPESMVWGPMHWGHATSKDLLHWEHRPIALYPDENGYIFSGSAVYDAKNSSGFGTEKNPPLVAIFTYHDADRKAAGASGFETQGLAYSLDNGTTWEKYDGNPVLRDDSATDLRDPKLFWYEPDQKWIMSLAAGDYAEFYGSKNLKDWQLLGKFGKDKGAHGGVWECPDLFPLKVEGSSEEKWVLLISINPGAPNGGSGTQYFIGHFDGKTFTTDQTEERWVDWGTDNYAGVTFSNAPNGEIIFLGWMSNWLYANETPTEGWRGAMTLPRKLSLHRVGERYVLFNYPIRKFERLVLGDSAMLGSSKDINSLNQSEGSEISDNVKLRDSADISMKVKANASRIIGVESLMTSEIRFSTSSKNFRLQFGNEADERLLLAMDSDGEVFSLDRSQSGLVEFQEDFAIGLQQMPVPELPKGEYEVRIVLDLSSIEIFINGGQYTMTAQIFPNEPYTRITVENPQENELFLNDFTTNAVDQVWMKKA